MYLFFNFYSSQGNSSTKYSRRNPDEFDVYNINPNHPLMKQSLCTKLINLVRSHWLLIQVIIVMGILGLPGNIMTIILHVQTSQQISSSFEDSSVRHLPSNEG